MRYKNGIAFPEIKVTPWGTERFFTEEEKAAARAAEKEQAGRIKFEQQPTKRPWE